MKKIILSFTTFISFFSLSIGFEANIKVGYDFFRHSNYNDEQVKFEKRGKQTREHHSNVKSNYERGFVLGVEILPFTFKDERIKLGLGLEYNFGEKTVEYHMTDKSSPDVYRGFNMMPLYATAKFTYYRPKNIDLNLYTFARLGYAFVDEGKPFFIDDKSLRHYFIYEATRNGIYYGLGLGIDYKYFLAEILYDGRYNDKHFINYLCNDDKDVKKCEIYHREHIYTKHFHHKVGVRLGVQLGTQHFKKPQITSNTKNETNMK